MENSDLNKSHHFFDKSLNLSFNILRMKPYYLIGFMLKVSSKY